MTVCLNLRIVACNKVATLALVAAGNLNNSTGVLNNRGSNGNYWSSTQSDGTNGWNLNFNSGNSNMNTNNKSYGFSVRCLRDCSLYQPAFLFLLSVCPPKTMAIYTNLPVFKKTYDLLLELIRTSSSLPRLYKYTFGERLQLEVIEVVINIYKSNSAISKVDHIAQARERLETLRLLIRALYDTKQITPKRMIYLNIFIEDISKQLTGWQKHSSETVSSNGK